MGGALAKPSLMDNRARIASADQNRSGCWASRSVYHIGGSGELMDQIARACKERRSFIDGIRVARAMRGEAVV